MIVHDMEQGTPEWFQVRMGVATAGSFDKLLTPTGKPSSQINAYAEALAAEALSGEYESIPNTAWMARGTLMEPEARVWYEIFTDREVEQVGFCCHEDGNYGCSPDGFIDKRAGGLEIKCPSPGVHMGYLNAGKIPNKYVPQVMGCMLVSGAKYWDFLSYHPSLPKLLVRVERDEAYLSQLSEALDKLVKLKEQAISKALSGDLIYKEAS